MHIRPLGSLELAIVRATNIADDRIMTISEGRYYFIDARDEVDPPDSFLRFSGEIPEDVRKIILQVGAYACQCKEVADAYDIQLTKHRLEMKGALVRGLDAALIAAYGTYLNFHDQTPKLSHSLSAIVDAGANLCKSAKVFAEVSIDAVNTTRKKMGEKPRLVYPEFVV
ncbi:MAG: hypothetical protein WC464_07890 [Bdellovibrionales bacterium]